MNPENLFWSSAWLQPPERPGTRRRRGSGDAVDDKSVIEQLLEQLRSHEDSEASTLKTYEEAATSSPDEGVRFLMGLILQDEERHHRLMASMAKDVEQSLYWVQEKDGLPNLAAPPDIRPQLLAQTEEFLGVEYEGIRRLEALSQIVKQMRSGMLDLIVDMLLSDSHKHVHMLEFIKTRLEEGD